MRYLSTPSLALVVLMALADGVGVYSDPCVEGWIVIVGISGFDDQAI